MPHPSESSPTKASILGAQLSVALALMPGPRVDAKSRGNLAPLSNPKILREKSQRDLEPTADLQFGGLTWRCVTSS